MASEADANLMTSDSSGGEPSDRMLKWFAFQHLPPHLEVISRPFAELAHMIAATIQAGPERTIALRKLLEAKDAAVRAKVHPGG